ncbi:hypothetical protein HDU77_000535 [Chytriomyces hyalinus]|nr:hypothetical protein HDU77_000535 [Chytriomyces hyalinus]
MLEEVNSLRKLLQIFLLSPPVATPACTAPSRPVLKFTPSRPKLESIPPEALDRIASFVSGSDILQLCHAVRYFKCIRKAMFDFGHLFKVHNAPRPAKLCPALTGYASINDSAGMEAILPVLPESLDVWIDDIKQLTNTDVFFSAIFCANKTIMHLSLGADYLERCNSDLASLDLTTKWLAKLRIRELRFPRFSTIPTQIRGMLHLVPMLESLHLRTLKDFVRVSLSECKSLSLRKLSIAQLFVGAKKKPEAPVQQLLDIVEASKSQQLEVLLP